MLICSERLCLSDNVQCTRQKIALQMHVIFVKKLLATVELNFKVCHDILIINLVFEAL